MEAQEGDEVFVEKKKIDVNTHIELYHTLINYIDAEIDRKCRQREPGCKALRYIRKTVITLKKQVPIIRKKVRKVNPSKGDTEGIDATTPRVNQFNKPRNISPELATFLGVNKTAQFTRAEIVSAIFAYCNFKVNEERPHMLRWAHLNPLIEKDGVKVPTRNLSIPNSKGAFDIANDKKLSTLLGYDSYKKEVQNGHIFKNHKNKETGEKISEVFNDDNIYFWTISKLISKHIL
jgi:chromatin remodeling complex protein RSC6